MDDKLNNIKAFLQEMATQDNRCTAAPYFYTIRDTVRIYGVDSDYDSDGCIFTDPDIDDACFETYDEYLKCCEDDEDYKPKEEDDLQLTHFKYQYVFKGMFLTESAAKKHLELNKHKYSDKAVVYVDHAFRSPELKQFFFDLFEHFGIDKGNWR